MRTDNSIKNVSAAFLVNFLSIIVGLIVQLTFIKTLGTEYLGLNGLFSNLISMLSIVELGFGTAIIFNLYKPIINKEYETIKSLMKLYRDCYQFVAIIILLLGLIIIPFLPLIVGANSISGNITIFYLLFLLDVVISYFLSYKRSILVADQKNYLINLIHIGYLIVLNTIQIYILLKTKNYYLFLIMKIIMRVLENLIINIVVNKKYNYLKEKNIQKIDSNILLDIKTKIKALFIHKIAGFVVSGTDNILISILFGLNLLGIYSNYYLIINSINILIYQVFSSITPSVGNLNVSTDKNKKFEVYRNIRFINVWISIFAATSLLVIMNSFIEFWLSSKFILNIYVLIALVLNYYLQSTRQVNLVFKEASGIFHEDRRIPIIESLINIVFSIMFAKIFGLVGIFMGTICSNLLLHLYSYPKYVYNKIFDRSYKKYYEENLKYFLVFVISAVITYSLSRFLNNNLYINILLSLIIPNTILYIFYNKSEEFNYYKNLIKKFKKPKFDKS